MQTSQWGHTFDAETSPRTHIPDAEGKMGGGTWEEGGVLMMPRLLGSSPILKPVPYEIHGAEERNCGGPGSATRPRRPRTNKWTHQGGPDRYSQARTAQAHEGILYIGVDVHLIEGWYLCVCIWIRYIVYVTVQTVTIDQSQFSNLILFFISLNIFENEFHHLQINGYKKKRIEWYEIDNETSDK